MTIIPPRFVLDCSVTMAWCFLDQRTEFTDQVLTAMADHEAIVPGIWALEVTNVLIAAERKNRLTPAVSSNFLAALGQLEITLESTPKFGEMESIMAMARHHGLSSYDASYMELAFREGLPLATTDKLLIRAAKKLKIEVVD